MMSQRFEFIVQDSGIRLDKYVSEQCRISRAYAQKLIDAGDITVNGQEVKPSHKPNIGDEVVVILPPPTPFSLAAEDIPLQVIYQDDDILVIDKPAGLTVHPAPGHPSHTLVNAILSLCPDLAGIGGSLRPGIVHRLDKNASGLMVVAKNDVAQVSLSHQIKSRTVVKKYLALVCGRLSPQQGVIEAPIGRHPRERKRMAVVSGGREARTAYQVVKYVKDHTLVQVQTETGRTHQIRVHFSAIGYPLFGDSVYGKRTPLLGRHFLHAHYLGFSLPRSGEFMEFHSGLPAELKEVLEHLSEDIVEYE
jgi:23S rRNA pseudouridine1911/1915/1917 synthase